MMQNVQMKHLRKAFFAEAEAILEKALLQHVSACNDTMDDSEATFTLPTVEATGCHWHDLTVRLEAAFDTALRDSSVPHEEAEQSGAVSGVLKKITLGDDFTVQIDVTADDRNNIFLFDMKKEKNVYLISAQGHLFDEDTEPDPDEIPADVQEEFEIDEKEALANLGDPEEEPSMPPTED